MRVQMIPPRESFGDPDNGIKRVVDAYYRYLPRHGVQLVPATSPHDLVAAHAGVGQSCEVAHCHGLNWTADYPGLSEVDYRSNALVVKALRQALQVTVPSEWVAETLRRDMHLDPHVVPHGIDWEDWQGQTENAGYVLWNKNRSDAICSPADMNRLAARVPHVSFISTFGQPASNVVISGPQVGPVMKGMIQRAGVYLATTKETFGIGTLEAMASGVPVLGYKWGGTAELVIHDETGYLVEPGNVEGLAHGLSLCIQNRKRLGEAARERAKTFGWDEVCRRVTEIYEMALSPQPPRVTVVIPCYNKRATVLRSVKSVLAQTHRSTDVVVVDDGSNDGSVDVLAEFLGHEPNQPVRVLHQTRGGVARARNAGLRATQSKYICFLDADDWLDPRVLEICVNVLERDRSLGLTYTGLRIYRSTGESSPNPWPGAYNYDRQVAHDNQVPTCCVIRREALERAGGFRPYYCPTGAGSEDADLWTRLGALGWGGLRATSDCMFNYQSSGGHTTSGGYREVDWMLMKPWACDGLHPFASVATPDFHSHPARQYDRPTLSVNIDGPGTLEEWTRTLDSLEGSHFRNWEAIAWGNSVEPVPVDLLRVFPYLRIAGRMDGVMVQRTERTLWMRAGDWVGPHLLTALAHADPGPYRLYNLQAWRYSGA